MNIRQIAEINISGGDLESLHSAAGLNMSGIPKKMQLSEAARILVQRTQ